MRRILFLTTRLPFPPFGGERLRPFYFIKYLCKSYKIRVLSFIESERELREAEKSLLENVEFRTVILPKYSSYLRCFGGLFSSKPLEISYYFSSVMQKAVKEELESGKYDLLFCHLLRMSVYAQNARVPKVLDVSDALSLRYALSSRYRKGPFKIVEHIESQRLSRYEPDIIKKFDLKLISSSRDKEFMERNLGVKGLVTIENGVDTEIPPLRHKPVDPNKIVFFANLRAFQNVEAVRFFYRDIFPLVKRQVSGAKLVIAGSCIPGCIRKLADGHSVEVYSDIANLEAVVEDACVSVAPMHIAVGVQNKIIQSMALGLAVVTTTLGLGGIAAVNGESVFVADEPSEFARKVVALMQDSALRNSIVTNAFKLITERYLWSRITKDLEQKISEILGG